jgi:cytochrome c5
MPKPLITAIVLAFAAWITPQTTGAQGAGRSGKAVVEAVCASCHATGAKGAPKIGDAKAWANLASRGLAGLTGSALKGIRNMPSHGGNPALTEIEIERAITHMVNQSGGQWSEPISDVTSAAERRGEQIVQTLCAKCHQTGVRGAPRIGDRAAWILRLKRGLDFVVRSAINGHGPMPPRGGMAELTDSEIRAAVVYMFNPVGAPTTGPADAPTARPDPNHKVVDGTEIYLGIAAAESMRAQYPKGSKESSMHGGIPSGKGYYHVNISLFDSTTRGVIADAQVEARVADPVMGGETKKLELVALNNMKSYGNYYRMPSKDPYAITVKIRRPGTSRTIEARFNFKHD